MKLLDGILAGAWCFGRCGWVGGCAACLTAEEALDGALNTEDCVASMLRSDGMLERRERPCIRNCRSPVASLMCFTGKGALCLVGREKACNHLYIVHMSIKTSAAAHRLWDA